MGKRGLGYGSEDHLRRYITDHEEQLNREVSKRTGAAVTKARWLAFPRDSHGIEREFRALDFLPLEDSQSVLAEWSKFWPARGHKQSWDAIGQAGRTWLLVEAKANHPEFCSPPTGASGASLAQIRRALGRVKRDLGVHHWFNWTGTYYQYANRLATLWFLRTHGVDARLLFIYFVGDRFPDSTPCPASEKEWSELIEARRLTLGLPVNHALSPYEDHVFLPALPADPA